MNVNDVITKNNFINDLTLPDIDKYYHHSSYGLCNGWTLIHKIVYFPQLLKKYLQENDVDINCECKSTLNSVGYDIGKLNPLKFAVLSNNIESIEILVNDKNFILPTQEEYYKLINCIIGINMHNNGYIKDFRKIYYIFDLIKLQNTNIDITKIFPINDRHIIINFLELFNIN